MDVRNDNIFITGCVKRQETIWSPCLRELKGNRKSGVEHTLEIMVLFANMTKKKKFETKAQIPLLLANQIEV